MAEKRKIRARWIFGPNYFIDESYLPSYRVTAETKAKTKN